MKPHSIGSKIYSVVETSVLFLAILTTVLLGLVTLSLPIVYPLQWQPTPPIAEGRGGGNVVLGDLDQDGDLDAVVGNGVWINEGRGWFKATGQRLEFHGLPVVASPN